MAHPENGQKLMKRFAEDIEEYGAIDRIPKMEGRSMVMFVTSKQSAKQPAAKPAKKADDAPTAPEMATSEQE
jgi:hypothetical protein